MAANYIAKPNRTLSSRTDGFGESVIREMTRLGAEVSAVDLGQGLPDFDPPAAVLEALQKASRIHSNHQYSFTWGLPEFRQAIAEKCQRFNGIRADPETDITVTCGVSEALVASIMALTEPGDEVIIFEPWYENYLPGCSLAQVTPRFVELNEKDFSLNPSALTSAINERTRLILLNTPGNPTGHVWNRDELGFIAEVCQRHGLIAVVDEIYEHIWYDPYHHISLASLPGMEDRTVTLSGLGKSYAVTGWRVGWAVASQPLTAKIRKVHDYLTVCAPTPFQAAGIAALALPDSYYSSQRTIYAGRRDILLKGLSQAGFRYTVPQGAYYVMADFSDFRWDNDKSFVDFLARTIGVVGVPGSSFFSKGAHPFLRLNFAKCEETLHEAVRRLTRADLRYKR